MLRSRPALARIALVSIAFFASLPLVASAQDANPDRCRAKKVALAAKHFAAVHKCLVKAESKQEDPTPCLDKAEARLTSQIEKLDTARKACASTIDAAALVALVDAQVGELLDVFARRVFRTSTIGGATFGGLAGADAQCQSLADAAGLGGRFIAMLSDSTTDMRDRIGPAPGGFVRIDDVEVATGRLDLFDGTLLAAIQVDENGATTSATEVWTGTSPSGTSGAGTCSDWTSTSGTTQVGVDNQTGFGWSSIYLQFCDRTNVALYCVEQ